MRTRSRAPPCRALRRGRLEGAESVGGTIANALLGFLMLPDYDLGSKLGWVAGLVIFEVALAILTAGGTAALEALAAPLRMLAQFLIRVNQVMERVFGAILHVIPGLERALGRIIGMLGDLPIFRQIRQFFSDVIDLGAAAMQRAGREATETAATTTTRAAAGHADDLARHADDVPAQPGRDVDLSAAEPRPPAARDADVRTTREVDSPNLSPQQLDDELRHLADNPHLMQGTPPNRTARMGDHTWREQPGGRWCRSSDPVCVIRPPDELAVPAEGAARSADEAAPARAAEEAPPARTAPSRERTTQALPEGQARTPAETAKAREYYRNHRDEAIGRWEERTGQTWPTDPATGRRVWAEHPRPLADGGDPLHVEPGIGHSNRPHLERGEGGVSDQQRWGGRRSNPQRPVERVSDPRVIDELPPGQARTPDELEAARRYFDNRKDQARAIWEERTGQQWPVDPATGMPARAEHVRPLADGGHPLQVEPGFGDPNLPHTTPRAGGGPSDQQRWGGRRRSTRSSPRR